MREFRTHCFRAGRIFASLLGLQAMLVATQADAQSCSFSMTSVAFGSVNVLPGAAVDTTATVTVTCQGGSQAVTACVNIACGSACDSTSRQMAGPSSQTARYDLFADSARSIPWGSWQTGYDTAGVQISVPLNGTVNQTVYARFLPSQQTDAAGGYTATVQAFMTYINQNGAGSCPVGALNNTASASVSATVSSNCTIAATGISFGTQGILSTNTDAQGTLSVQCTEALPYIVSLDGGLSGATNPTQRQMTFNSANVVYGLYQDAARSQPWGSSSGVNTLSGTGTGATQTLNVYGRVAPQTTPAPGTYTDTIVATITY
jgi:spore coat protein U-like protein